MEKKRDSAGKFVRREERPDPNFTAHPVGLTDIPLNDPDYHYRVVGKDDPNRVGIHRDLEYGVAKENQTTVVMGCKKEVRERRAKAAREKSEKRLAPYEGTEDGMTSSIKQEKSDLGFDD
jgi:hypothetical protein